jgi:hypothetical protein
MRIESSIRHVVLLVTVQLAWISPLDAHAAERYWVGPTGGLWSNPMNWSATPGGPGGAGVPTTMDAAIAASGMSAYYDFVYTDPGISVTNLGSPLLLEQDDPMSVMVAAGEIQLPRFNNASSNGTGQYIQSAGTCMIGTSLRLGGHTLSGFDLQGFYTLSGNATLSVPQGLAVSSGLYTQTGGLCTVALGAELGNQFTFPQTPGGIAMSGGTLNLGGITQNWGTSTFSGGYTTVGSAGIDINHGSIVLAGGTLSVGTIFIETSQPNQFLQTGGAMTITGQLMIDNTSAYHFDGGSLSVGSISATGGRFFVGPGADRVFRTGGITLSPGPNTKMDLNQGAALVDYAATSPISTIRGYIVSGRNNGSWNGSGINSSFAAANAEYSVGFAEASAIFANFPATFRGEAVDDTTVIVATVRTGDANLDGKIDLADFNRLASNFGGLSGKVWSQGDFNYDGMTNLADFNLLAGNFGLSAGPNGVVDPQDWAALAAAVPEPAMTGLPFALAAFAALRRGQRSRARATN